WWYCQYAPTAEADRNVRAPRHRVKAIQRFPLQKLTKAVMIGAGFDPLEMSWNLQCCRAAMCLWPRPDGAAAEPAARSKASRGYRYQRLFSALLLLAQFTAFAQDSGPPQITVQPQDQSANTGSNVVFSVEAIGAQPL